MEDKRFITTRGIIVTGWALLLLLGVTIISASLYIWIDGGEPPEVLVNWGASVLGFFFGSFVGLLKDFLKSIDE